MTDNKLKPIIYVTGFGPFGNVRKNPSEEVAGKLKYTNLESELDVKLVTERLEVSYKDVDEKVNYKWEKLHPTFVIHLGVNEGLKNITLEKQASNDYTRKDIYNCNPSCNVACKDGPPTLKTSLNLEEAMEKLNSSSPDIKFSLSCDSGPFLCGYSYYTSLNRDCSRSLFIHIPNAETVSCCYEEGIAKLTTGVADVIKILYKEISKRDDRNIADKDTCNIAEESSKMLQNVHQGCC